MSSHSNLYRQYVVGKWAYRVVPSSQVAAIRKRGIVFGKDPYARFHEDAERLFRIALRLYRKGVILTREWNRTVDQKTVIAATRKDIRLRYLDFTTDRLKTRFYKKLKGGALVTTLSIMAGQVAESEASTDEERRFAKRLAQRLEPIRKPMVVLRVKLTDPIFQTAQLQGFDRVHLRSPFGGESHFEKTVTKYGWKAYEPYLTGTKQFYLRVKTSVPAASIR